MAMKPRLKVVLPRGSKIICYVTNTDGDIVYIIYTDSQGNPHIISNSKGATPLD
jgi:hypothetical protein